MTYQLQPTTGAVAPSPQTKTQQRPWRAMLWLLPLLGILSLFSLAPAVWVVVNSAQVEGLWSLANFIEILGSSFYR